MMKQFLKDSPFTTLKRRCPICHFKEGYVLHTLSYALFDDNPMPSEIEVVSCAHCGFLYYDISVTESDLQEFYSHHYIVNSYDFRASYAPEILYLKEMAGFIKDLGLSKDAKIIDVGCGPGHLLKFIQAEGYRNLCGVELCQDYIQTLKSEGIEAVFGSAMSLPETTQGSSCFIYKWLFEHLLDLHKPIESLIEKIIDNGFVVVEVPDTFSYDAFNTYAPPHHFIIEHINHFSLHHLSELFSIHGFEIVRIHKRLNDQHESRPFPQICIIFQYKGKSQKKEIIPDHSLAKRARAWFRTTPNFDRSDLREIRDNNVSVHVWGLSYRTLMHIAMSPLKECNIVGYYDKDPGKQKKTLGGKPILSPDSLVYASDADAIVIGVGPSALFMKEHLLSSGFRGKIISL